MQPLSLDPATGFLQSSSNYLHNFTAEKKTLFIKRTLAIQRESGKWPNFAALCDEIGIDPRTLERHMKVDPKFSDDFRNVLLKAKWKMESGIYDLSSKNPMYALIWLRKWFPSEYNPEYKANITVDVNVVDQLAQRADAVEAELISTQQAIKASPSK